METGRAEAAARREEVCRGGQKSCGVSQKVGRRFPRRAASGCQRWRPVKTGSAERLKCLERLRWLLQLSLKTNSEKGLLLNLLGKGGLSAVRVCSVCVPWVSGSVHLSSVGIFFLLFIVSCILVCVILYCVHGGFYAYLRMSCFQKKEKERKEKSKECLWHEKSIK